MSRTTPVWLALAALITSGTVHAAVTPSQTAKTPAKTATAPAKTASTAPAAAKTAAVPVTPASMASMMGTWTIPLETPSGRLVASIVFRVEGGKVVAGISAPQLPEQKTTDITKNGQVITLKASMDYSGPLASYSGPVSMVATLTPKGTGYAAWFDFNSAAFQIGGTATKKP